MRSVTSALILPLLAAVLGGRLIAQSPAPPAPPPAAEGKTEATIAGKWNMTIEVQNGERTSTVDFKLDGRKVSGTAIDSTGTEYAISGELTDRKLTFTVDYQNLKLVFAGALRDDGSLAGTMDYGEGPNTWKAERIKDK